MYRDVLTATLDSFSETTARHAVINESQIRQLREAAARVIALHMFSIPSFLTEHKREQMRNTYLYHIVWSVDSSRLILIIRDLLRFMLTL